MLSQIIIETDSLAMVHIIEGQWEIPCCVALEVMFIQNLKRIVSAKVQDFLREGNALVDYFATKFLFLQVIISSILYKKFPMKAGKLYAWIKGVLLIS